MVALAICLTAAVRAEDKKVDLNGLWKWTIKAQDGTERTSSLKLKQDGAKITGTLTGGRDNQESEIKEAALKDGELSFKVTRKRNDQEFTISYNGKVDGDTIKGKSVFGEGDNKREREWEAKRVKE